MLFTFILFFRMIIIMDKQVIETFVSLLLSGDRLQCSKVVKQYIKDGLSIKEVYESLFKPALYEVGVLWEENKISVADEHLATSISEAILNELYENVVSEERQNRSAILACVEGETHQVGLKMVADIFEMNGWDVKYLGSTMPTLDLVKFIEKYPPDLIGLSLSIYFHLNTLKEMTMTILEKFPNQQILLGGQGFLHGSAKDFIQNNPSLHYCPTLYCVEEFIKSYE